MSRLRTVLSAAAIIAVAAALPIVLAPNASAAVPAPVVTPGSIAEGESFTVSGSCPDAVGDIQQGENPTVDINLNGLGFVVLVAVEPDGTFSNTFEANPSRYLRNGDNTSVSRIPAGTYAVSITCQLYNSADTSPATDFVITPGADVVRTQVPADTPVDECLAASVIRDTVTFNSEQSDYQLRFELPDGFDALAASPSSDADISIADSGSDFWLLQFGNQAAGNVVTVDLPVCEQVAADPSTPESAHPVKNQNPVANEAGASGTVNLAETGLDVAPVGVGAAALLGSGAVLLFLTRRPRREH